MRTSLNQPVRRAEQLAMGGRADSRIHRGWARWSPLKGHIAGSLDGPHTALLKEYGICRCEAAYCAELVAFVGLLRQGSPPLAGIRGGYEVQRLAEAATLSDHTDLPVELSPASMRC
jgi:predicted dehydrogenase